MSFLTLEAQRIPIVSIGTSPFMGAGQFEQKAYYWAQKFLNNPDLVAELLIVCAENGCNGIEMIPIGRIPEAVKLIKDRFPEFTVLGSTYWSKPYRIDELNEYGAKIIFIHGSIADRRNIEEIEILIKKIRNCDKIPGIATHEPIKTIPFIENSGLDCPAILTPFNKLGLFMENQKELENIVDHSDKFIMGMKTLAAGRLKPKEAYKYIKEHNISAVAIGMVSEEEIKETVPIALENLSNRSY